MSSRQGRDEETTLLDLFRHPRGLADLTPDQLEALLEARPDLVLIDVRTRREFRAGHIEGALSYPLGSEARLARDAGPSQKVVLVCKTGHRSQAAAAELLRRGFRDVSHLAGGMDAWRRARKPEVRGKATASRP
ncbi:MAG: rhodanese-like domain-containing protein [Bacillota bacterium]|nr:rhodanese-like domain-containing protein [Bacillota bacterium]MDI3317479.1 rhodanese-like domain-containing protein [Bacillota bacterium]